LDNLGDVLELVVSLHAQRDEQRPVADAAGDGRD
jgi:hypothetical protein